MALLCEACHSRVTRGYWSKQKIKNAMLNPWSLQNGGCRDGFDISADKLIVWLGPNMIVDIPTILEIDGRNILKVEWPEEPGAPYRLSGMFCDDNGSVIFEIDRNEWLGRPRWDLECVGPVTTIRSSKRHIALRIRAIPPHGIVIERASMNFRGIRLEVDLKGARIIDIKGGGGFNVSGRTARGLGGANSKACLFSTPVPGEPVVMGPGGDGWVLEGGVELPPGFGKE
jgi:hypothetical protein